MVVADPNRESVVALQYALSHVLFEQDELILLHVENQNPSWKYTFSTFLKRPSVGSSSSSSSIMGSSEGGGSCGAVPVDVDFLEEMKSACKVAHPKVRVRVERVEMEGKDKANAILFQSHQLGIDVIVIGQRRSLSTAILGCTNRNKRPLRGTKVVDTAEYLIENSKCTCVAVQKKGQNAGFLLNTKTHRNFWLLA
ncbi:hypothetical protein ACB092_02G109800 [Castanea dentata]